MTMTTNQGERLALLESRIRAMLPEEYQESYQDMQPVPMRSAGLKYRADGRVAWDQIWGSFCDLAMAGGPPHKGTLLEPGQPSEIAGDLDRYEEVAEEICRGIRMAADLDAEWKPISGWVRVSGMDETMAGWLLRAIVMENVSARAAGAILELPAAPWFRLDKEIKNVVTVIAKTSHYWLGHMSPDQHHTIAGVFADMARERPLIAPALPDGATGQDLDALRARVADALGRGTGLPVSARSYRGWIGVECPTVRAAIWMMRAMVVSNVLARREGTVLFVPLDPATDPDGRHVAGALAGVRHLCAASGAL
jgi:hypothetical protein